MEIITRTQAKESGLKYFFTGKVCKRGHLSKRKVGCGTCYECHLLLGKPYHYNDTVKNRRINWSEEQKERNKTAKRNYANSEKGKSKNKEYLETLQGKQFRKKALENQEEKQKLYRKTVEGKKILRERSLKFKYGITLIDFENMLKLQENKCKICKKHSERILEVDHCHKSNKVRGLLCHKCNKGLGLFLDDLEILISAVEYLKE